MSDSSDDAEIEWALFEEMRDTIEEKINFNKSIGVWETSTGKKIPFENITSSHKKNIINFCKRIGIKALETIW